jgi:hypothetical protein
MSESTAIPLWNLLYLGLIRLGFPRPMGEAGMAAVAKRISLRLPTNNRLFEISYEAQARGQRRNRLAMSSL